MTENRAIWEPLQTALRQRLISLGQVDHADLSHFDLTGVHAVGAQVDWSSLANACLAKADLADAHLRQVDLTGANLKEANLVGATFVACELEGVQWQDALYGSDTRFPDGFDPVAQGLHLACQALLGATGYVDTITLDGQPVNLCTRWNDRERVRAMIRESVVDIHLPKTHRVNVSHGSYGRYSRYELDQRKYAGGGHGASGGYMEALAIELSPTGHGRGIFHEQGGGLHRFVEYDTPDQAVAAWNYRWGHSNASTGELVRMAGAGRWLEWCHFVPWFYAVGDEQEYEDRGFLLPRGMSDDPVFRLGSRWLAFNQAGWPRVVVCLGSRLERRPAGGDWYNREREHDVRVVYWHDGTTWEPNPRQPEPRRLADDEPVWLNEAHRRLDQIMTGEDDHFILDLVDGRRVTVRVKQPGVGRDQSCRAGQYHCDLTIDRALPGRRWVEDDISDEGGRYERRAGTFFGEDFDFDPTPECPTPEEWMRRRVAGLPGSPQIVTMRLKLVRPKEGGKRWSGVTEYFG